MKSHGLNYLAWAHTVKNFLHETKIEISEKILLIQWIQLED